MDRKPDGMADAFADEAALREAYGEPSEIVRRKQLPALEKHCRNFIAQSPFLCMATSDAEGRADVSPRGDPPGFVQVLDDHTLLIPDRPGNKRLDSLRNILANPRVGLIFFIPGVNETLRVNGWARIVRDGEALAPLAVNGKAPLSGILVTVEEAYLHCAKALIRSRLWGEDYRVAKGDFPTLGQMLADQVETGRSVSELDAVMEESIRDRLY
ncbi:pyridoxamine 5'-phosphate oxidase family protein [Oceanibacterium hippocampi]|uniref:Pyridoxamine 5'-phosphate oxidase n=1 Tax=Oceanibacterium hippocampi TaxID=745714 RepID=A0A1Y5SLS0_9PROT|nr:pyridoxamine 5'-phosphate oxidase family protein [Oceanibacterium hippocampi]SLN43678.1 Pyridoxamine 5'-phosphate oxidase [Oceanibacterium hippocampi]